MQWLFQWVTDPWLESHFSHTLIQLTTLWTPPCCLFPKVHCKFQQQKGRGSHSFSIWWNFRNRSQTEGTPIIKFSYTHTHNLLVSSQFQFRLLSFLSFSKDTFGDETIHNCPSTDSLWQHNWQWVCCKKKWKCCFNNLGLKYILLYASKGFNKKSTCRDIFSWLKQQSKAYKCSPTIMTYL